MSKKLKELPRQGELFTAPITCPDIHNLPLITDPRGAYEVRAPGSLYQPVLLTPNKSIDVGPGRLNSDEEKLIRDLIRFLYPKGDHPKSDKSPLMWGDREVWLKRNIEKDKSSFRLKVDESDWFYPDFIIWILDKKTRTQTFGFVDPKGLAIGAAGGWGDYKIVSTIYMPHVVEQQLATQEQSVVWEAEKWDFRIRGVLVSTSSIELLSEHAKFDVYDDRGPVGPTEADFERARIVFQKDDASYIEKILRLLVQDTALDAVCVAAAKARATNGFIPATEVEFDVALRMSETPCQTECEFAKALVREYLKAEADGQSPWAKERRRNELYRYAKEGLLGVGAEKVKDLRDHPTPCQELWKRKLGRVL